MDYALSNIGKINTRLNNRSRRLSNLKNQSIYDKHNFNNSFSFNGHENHKDIYSSLTLIEDNFCRINTFNLKEKNNINNSNNKKSNSNTYHKSNYEKLNKNSCLIGRKNKRNFFYKEIEENFSGSIENKKNDNELNINVNEERENFSNETKVNKGRNLFDESVDKMKRKIINKRNNNFQRNEIYNYKEKIMNKIKENNLIANKKNLIYHHNNIIRPEFNYDEKTIKKKGSNLLNKYFTNLRFTHTQRFSYHSTNKKSKKQKASNSNYIISCGNNISIISPSDNKRKFNNEYIINQTFLNDKSNIEEDKNLFTNKNEITEKLIRKKEEAKYSPKQENSPNFTSKTENKLFNFNELFHNNINEFML